MPRIVKRHRIVRLNWRLKQIECLGEADFTKQVTATPKIHNGATGFNVNASVNRPENRARNAACPPHPGHGNDNRH